MKYSKAPYVTQEQGVEKENYAMSYRELKLKWEGLLLGEKLLFVGIVSVILLVTLLVVSVQVLLPSPNDRISNEDSRVSPSRPAVKPPAPHLVTSYVAITRKGIRLEPTTDFGIPHVRVTIQFNDGRTESHEVFQTLATGVSLETAGTVANVELETPDGTARSFYDCTNVKEYCTRYRTAAKELR